MTDDPWMAAMRRGDFEQAWTISDRHLTDDMPHSRQNFDAPRHLQHIWDGRSLAGKRVLVRCYHGLGDTIQFLRFMAPLRQIASHVALWVQPALQDIARTVPGVDLALPLHDGAPEWDYDADIEIMELAHALRIKANDLPGAVPYVFPPRSLMKNSMNTGLMRIGLVWSSGGWDTRRSIPPALLRPLADKKSVALFTLQRGAAPHANRLEVPDAGSDDISTLAWTIANEFDLVISVDTFVAHLAGALGVPVWIMLHAECDWRWGNVGNRTLWYPSACLFRQRRPGDWSTVIDDVENKLNERQSVDHPIT